MLKNRGMCFSDTNRMSGEYKTTEGTRFCRYTTAAALLLFLSVFYGCKRKGGAMEQPVPPVTAAEAVSSDVPVYIDEIGTCVAMEVVSIRPQVSGQITGTHFADGANLKKGDLLFTIDARSYEAALSQAKASLAQSSASLALAKLEFERAKELLPARAISKEDYDTKENAVAVSEAQVQASKAAIEAAQVNVDYCHIHSPTDGRAGQALIDTGNVVTTNSNAGSGPVLLVIQRMDPIYADFTITERELPVVRGAMAKGTLKAQVQIPNGPEGDIHEGDLTFLDNAVQEESGTVKLRATLANGNYYFWPGQFVRVRLVLETRKEAVLVPSEAVQISQKGSYVYVVRSDSTAEFRLVKPGQRQGELVVITEGLKAGEKVVTSGHLTIRPAGKVLVREAEQQGGEGQGYPQKSREPGDNNR